MTPKQLREKHKEDVERSKLRQQYRGELEKARLKYGNWIPFGYNLEKLKDHPIPINKDEEYHSKLIYK